MQAIATRCGYAQPIELRLIEPDGLMDVRLFSLLRIAENKRFNTTPFGLLGDIRSPARVYVGLIDRRRLARLGRSL